MLKVFCMTFVAATVAIVAGCGQSAKDGTPGSGEKAPSVDGSKYLLAVEPKGALEIIGARASAKDKDDVVVVGRIGGSESPWVEDLAAFTIVDSSLKACSDIPGDACEKPWDYCCETDKLPNATALVQIVDESGKVVKADARKLLNVKELSTVVVRGKAKRDAKGNLTILATGIHVKK